MSIKYETGTKLKNRYLNFIKPCILFLVGIDWNCDHARTKPVPKVMDFFRAGLNESLDFVTRGT